MKLYNQRQYNQVRKALEEQLYVIGIASEAVGRELDGDLDSARETLAITIEGGEHKLTTIMEYIEVITATMIEDFKHCLKENTDDFKDYLVIRCDDYPKMLKEYLFNFSLDFAKGQ